MKLPNHKYLFFTESHSLLFSSLQRYFDHVLNQNLNPFSETELLTSPTIILLYKEEKENPDLLKIVANNSSIKIIVVGFDSNSSINTIDFANLKNNFVCALRNDYSHPNKLFTEDELKEKLKNFFHSHGENSLFEYLNWTYYFLRNGPEQLLNDGITYEEYKNTFLLPGIKKWDFFKSRFIKYKDILQLSCYNTSIDDLEKQINKVDCYISELFVMSGEKVFTKNIKYFDENIDKVKKIDEILTTFFKDLQLGDSRVQNTFS